MSRSGEQLVWALAGTQGKGWGNDKHHRLRAQHSEAGRTVGEVEVLRKLTDKYRA